LTKDQLLKRGWDGNYCCVLCGKYEDIHHLFVQWLTVQVIWNWIANFNNFTFNDASLDDMWLTDSIYP
jgi:hypothetical protein